MAMKASASTTSSRARVAQGRGGTGKPAPRRRVLGDERRTSGASIRTRAAEGATGGDGQVEPGQLVRWRARAGEPAVAERTGGEQGPR